MCCRSWQQISHLPSNRHTKIIIQAHQNHHPGTPKSSSRHTKIIIQAYQNHHPGTPKSSSRHTKIIIQAYQNHHPGIPKSSSRHTKIIIQAHQNHHPGIPKSSFFRHCDPHPQLITLKVNKIKALSLPICVQNWRTICPANFEVGCWNYLYQKQSKGKCIKTDQNAKFLNLYRNKLMSN